MSQLSILHICANHCVIKVGDQPYIWNFRDAPANYFNVEDCHLEAARKVQCALANCVEFSCGQLTQRSKEALGNVICQWFAYCAKHDISISSHAALWKNGEEAYWVNSTKKVSKIVNGHANQRESALERGMIGVIAHNSNTGNDALYLAKRNFEDLKNKCDPPAVVNILRKQFKQEFNSSDFTQSVERMIEGKVGTIQQTSFQTQMSSFLQSSDGKRMVFEAARGGAPGSCAQGSFSSPTAYPQSGPFQQYNQPSSNQYSF